MDRRPMFRRSNRLTLTGLSGRVDVVRDSNGVPHITAATADDALLGLGYVHATDRGLQLLVVRTLGRGEACLRLDDSDKMLAIDTFFRRLDFRRDVDSEYARLSPSELSAIAAYCRGVDLGFRQAGIPWELKLLGFRLGDDPWTFADVVLTAKIIGYIGLAMTQGEMELWLLECIQAGIGLEFLEELFPGRLDGLDLDMIRRIKLKSQFIPQELRDLAALPKAVASNNWAVAGSKSAAGSPLVCNDPHLEVNRLPAVFYESVLRWGDPSSGNFATGASVPGTPGIVSGRNKNVAWSVTYAYMDSIDSWVEDCREGLRRRGDDWVPFRVREETILRKKNPPARIKVYETPEHGTLDGDPTSPGLYLSTRWSNGEGTSAGALSALIGMMNCPDVEDGRRQLAQLSNSAWCWVLGDSSGSIGYQMSGKLPIRREGADGLTPLPGWDADNDWRGFVEPEDLPRALNPPEGFLVTANDDLNHLGVAKPINLTLVPYRAERIREVLAGPGPFTVDSMKALQYDLTSTQARRFLPTLREALAAFEGNANAATLANWDGTYSADSRGATLFESFYRALFVEVFTTALAPRGGAMVDHLLKQTSLLSEYYAIYDNMFLAESSRWFSGRSRVEVFKAAVERSGLLNSSPGPWAEVQRVRMRNILLGDKLPLWAGFDLGPISLPGGRATVCQGQVSTAMGYPSATGPSFRSIADLSTDELHTNLPGGPSDRRFSAWYANDLSNWLSGVYKTLRGRAGAS